jgi:class 3 adenylate cyclase
MCALFAATHPDRTTALILYGGYARRLHDTDYPEGVSAEANSAFLDEIRTGWGGPVGLDARAPTKAHDPRFRETWARYLRLGASPSAVLALMKMNAEIDVRAVLPTIRVPTLVLHREGDRVIPPDTSRYMAEHIPGARYVDLPGIDHLPWVGEPETVLGEIEEFLTGIRAGPRPDRVLTTVLFTDIVGSTEMASRLGDQAWSELLQAHNQRVREQLTLHGGREIDTAGDAFLATFDGPARAVLCARAIVDAVRALGLEVRAGVHTGEVELVVDDVRGLAVHIGARIAAMAGPSEVLASRTVKDLVVGSGLLFEDRGTHRLKGVPDEWQVFAVAR